MHGNWIQDPRSIPPEVVEEIKNGLVKIPPELLIYTQAYEKRLPEDPDLREMILQAREDWRNEVANMRRASYLALSSTDSRQAEDLWEMEQRENPWIFGTEIHSLY